MDLVFLILFVLCIFVGGIVAGMVMFALPVWALVDVSYARDLDEPSRTALIILIAMSIGGFVLFCFMGGFFAFLLGPFAFLAGFFFMLVPLIYSGFITKTRALKQATLIALTVLLVTSLGSVAFGYGTWRFIKHPDSFVNRMRATWHSSDRTCPRRAEPIKIPRPQEDLFSPLPK